MNLVHNFYNTYHTFYTDDQSVAFDMERTFQGIYCSKNTFLIMFLIWLVSYLYKDILSSVIKSDNLNTKI